MCQNDELDVCFIEYTTIHSQLKCSWKGRGGVGTVYYKGTFGTPEEYEIIFLLNCYHCHLSYLADPPTLSLIYLVFIYLNT